MTQDLIKINKEGKGVTTSLKVAEIFGKRHDHVLRDIETLSCSGDFRLPNFGEIDYVDSKNRKYKAYEITKDGFSFLVMGYTGDKAGQFKETFINEFNKREALLTNDDFIVSKALSILNERTKALEIENERKTFQLEKANEVIQEQAPKVKYHNEVLNAENTHTTTTIAKELGMSAKSLNSILKSEGIQYFHDGHWILYQKHQAKGFTKTRTHTYYDSQGAQRSSIQTVWTEKGREFIHNTMNPVLVN